VLIRAPGTVGIGPHDVVKAVRKRSLSADVLGEGGGALPAVGVEVSAGLHSGYAGQASFGEGRPAGWGGLLVIPRRITLGQAASPVHGLRPPIPSRSSRSAFRTRKRDPSCNRGRELARCRKLVRLGATNAEHLPSGHKVDNGRQPVDLLGGQCACHDRSLLPER
jgi:hypothetical protein